MDLGLLKGELRGLATANRLADVVDLGGLRCTT